MNGRVKELWINALRSGKYQQTTEVLHRKEGNKDSFCCLGVLCDLATNELDIVVHRGFYTVAYDNAWTILPPLVVKWAELDEHGGENPIVLKDAQIFEELGEKANKDIQTLTLAELNDKYELNFNQIADIIEKYL